MPQGALPNPARLIHSVSASSDTLTLDSHGFYDGDPVSFRADSVGGSLPAPLTDSVTYYARRVSDDAFAVATDPSGGSPINLTSAGTRVLVLAPVPVEPAIAWATAIIDDMLPAHLVPLEAPIPEIVKMTCAELAVGKLMSRQGAAPETLSKAVSDAQARLVRWSKGIPLRGAAVPKRANLAARASAGYRDAKGWRTDETI